MAEWTVRYHGQIEARDDHITLTLFNQSTQPVRCENTWTDPAIGTAVKRTHSDHAPSPLHRVRERR